MNSTEKTLFLRQITFLYIAIPISKLIFGFTFVVPAMYRLIQQATKTPWKIDDSKQVTVDTLIGIHLIIVLLFLFSSWCICLYLTKNIDLIRLSERLKLFIRVNMIVATISSFLHAIPMIWDNKVAINIENLFTLMGWESFTMANLITLAILITALVEKRRRNDREIVTALFDA